MDVGTPEGVLREGLSVFLRGPMDVGTPKGDLKDGDSSVQLVVSR